MELHKKGSDWIFYFIYHGYKKEKLNKDIYKEKNVEIKSEMLNVISLLLKRLNV